MVELIARIEKINISRDVWVTCPECRKMFNVDREVWEEPKFSALKLFCPFCQKKFAKEKALQTLYL